QAFGNYETMMDLTEKIILDAIDAIGGGYQRPWGEKAIDFTPPFARKTYDQLFQEQTGIDPKNATGVKALAEKIGFETAGKHPDVIKSEVFEEKVEDALTGPIFVIDYPASICPLTKRKKTDLNDPDLQEELFRTQLAGQGADDSMAKMDDDFITALRHGMPPAGGLGIG